MKKLFIIGGVVVIIFALLVFLSNKSNEKKLEENPYGTDDLKQSTIGLIGNENYDNIIMPDELSKKVDSGEPVVAYFFSPDCSHCMNFTPVMMPIAKEMKVDVHQFNMLEFGDEGEKRFGITQWPILVYFKDGIEVFRMEGDNPEKNVRAFFDETKKAN